MTCGLGALVLLSFESDTRLCMDAMDAQAAVDGYAIPTAVQWWSAFADAVGDQSCSEGCTDRFKPLCMNGECKMPSCASDVQQYCGNSSTVGVLARWYCPQVFWVSA